jgi:Family of unknown function (DUF6788)
MQKDPLQHYRLSRLRQELLEVLERLGKALEVALARTPLVKGSVYQIARRCGNPHCRCTRGQLHRNFVLTWSERGRHRMRSLPPQRVSEVRQKSKEYARFRRARAEISVLYKRILALLEQIQELRREAP